MKPLDLRSPWDLHAAHPVGEAVRPQGGNVVLLDLHLVALEVRELMQADFVLQAVLSTLASMQDRAKSMSFSLLLGLAKSSEHTYVHHRQYSCHVNSIYFYYYEQKHHAN